MAKGKRTGGGSRKGIPNHATRDVREAIAIFAQANVERMGEWIERISADDPAKAFDLYLRAIEYHIPKLSRAEHSGPDGSPIPLKATVEHVRPSDPGS